jgi:integrase
MSTIQKISRAKGIVYRVLIRKSGMKAITKTFPTKKEAIQFSQKIEGSIQEQIAFTSLDNKLTFKELAGDYIVKECTIKRPQEQASKLGFWVKHIGIKQVNNISSSDIYNTLDCLPKHLSNATYNRYKAAASVVFNYACRQYNLTSNPIGLIPSKPEDNHRVRYLSTSERKRLLKACRETSWSKLYLLVLAAITTGARRGELLNLRWNDIDFERQTAYVQTTKNGQPKVLPLTDDVIKELTKFRQQDSSLIFNSEIKPDKAFCFNKQWKKALKEAEVEDFTFHCLRHTCASYLAQSGASLLEIADVLGHKQISVTKRYAHLCIDHKEKLINKVMSNI